jgi:four helix bundle protein
MATITRFEDLRIWQNSLALDEELIAVFTFEVMKYDLGMRSQILNSSGSCMDNIAEGFGRGGNKEFINFLRISKASIDETRSQMRRAHTRKYISHEESERLANTCEEIAKSIGAMIKYLRQSGMKGARYVSEPDTGYGLGEMEE